MANSYYSIRVDSSANAQGDLKAALLDYYGAYNDPANLNGVRLDYDSGQYLIFRCAAIADQYIRFNWSADQALWSYGDGVSGSDVTNPVRFGGTSTIGSVSEAHLVLGPNTLLWQDLSSTQNSRLIVIGQLSNDDYALFGCLGHSGSTYNTNCTGANTTDGTLMWPVSFSAPFRSAAGNLYTQSLILRIGAAGISGIELNGDGSAASFQDLLNVSYSAPATAHVLGAGFILTTANMYMYMGGAMPVLQTGLLMEFEVEE